MTTLARSQLGGWSWLGRTAEPLEVLEGKKIVEVRRRGYNKGVVARLVAKAAATASRPPLAHVGAQRGTRPPIQRPSA